VTFTFRNLGCAKNVVDGETMMAHLQAMGLRMVENPSRAHVIIVNTCAFIHEAKEEAIEEILQMSQWKKRGQCRLLAVAGCFSQRYRTQARSLMPEVDVWLSLSNWKEELRRRLAETAPAPAASPVPPRRLTGLVATQYLKIADGCSHRCSFCAIPFIRGPYHSRPAASIIKEAQWLESRGARECILVSQDTTYYGRDKNYSLVKLLEKLLAATSFPWIRLMYLHPRRLDRGLLRLIASEPRLCPYFDMPLQHSADPILRSMRRAPLSRDVRRLIETIRSTVAGAVLRTTFIVGYPGETEAHFKDLIRFTEWARFEKLGVFAYSAEEGTAAAGMPHRVPHAVACRRRDTLLEIQRGISRSILAALRQTVAPVIVDRVVPSGRRGWNGEGRTRGDAPEVDGIVRIRGSGFSAGDIISVRITGNSDYDLDAVYAPENIRRRKRSISKHATPHSSP